MTFEELLKKKMQAFNELNHNRLGRFGFSIQIELSINTYREMLNDYNGRLAIQIDDNPKEAMVSGRIFGNPFVVTNDTDRVLIAKEIK